MDAESENRKTFSKIVWSLIAAFATAGLFYWIFYLRFIEYTDDAYVHGNPVAITPIHAGFVTSIHTDDTFLVKKGELLVELDKTDADIAFQKAKEDLAQTVRQVCGMFHQVFVYNAEVDLKTAELIRDAQDFLHRHGVFRQQGVSLEDYEHAIAALRAKAASLEMSGALYRQALAEVYNTSIADHPLVAAAADRMRDAWVFLYRCNLYSPVTGLAAQRTIQVGMQIPAGQPLMTVIPLDQIWINANYKETQLKHMRLGQKVKITADLWGDKIVFKGRIVGLPGGAGNAFSLLPPQNLSGNWIKIVQRLPVRVALDPKQIQKHPLRLGLTCKATVKTRNRKGKMVPDSTVGSPLYETDVFAREEAGDKEFIQEIVAANLDPSLAAYYEQPIRLESRMIALPSILKEAFRQDAILQKQIGSLPPPASEKISEFHSPLFELLYREYLR